MLGDLPRLRDRDRDRDRDLTWRRSQRRYAVRLRGGRERDGQRGMVARLGILINSQGDHAVNGRQGRAEMAQHQVIMKSTASGWPDESLPAML